jgi:ribonucleases P/MRP protein subunit RPP40
MLDDTFSLHEGATSGSTLYPHRPNNPPGTLTMYLERETYERTGLVGKPYGVKGDRGTKPRWSTSSEQWSITPRNGS